MKLCDFASQRSGSPLIASVTVVGRLLGSSSTQSRQSCSDKVVLVHPWDSSNSTKLSIRPNDWREAARPQQSPPAARLASAAKAALLRLARRSAGAVTEWDITIPERRIGPPLQARDSQIRQREDGSLLLNNQCDFSGVQWLDRLWRKEGAGHFLLLFLGCERKCAVSSQKTLYVKEWVTLRVSVIQPTSTQRLR